MKQSWKHLKVGLSAVAIGAMLMFGLARVASAIEPGPDGSCSAGCNLNGNTVPCGPWMGSCAQPSGLPGGSPNGDCQVGEQCDDGNTINGDGCDNNCSFTACGNGISTAGEECDNGAANDNKNVGAGGNACDTNCRLKSCGNGRVEGGEQCDDGDTFCDDDCDSCMNGTKGNCLFPGCGNGIVDTGEACDDGNTVNGDGCDNNCTASACGNGIVDVSMGEQCDDGNTVNGDGCEGNCKLPRCGDGITDNGEQCDDGNTTACDGCSATCKVEACGNGVKECAEQCDDGNTVNGDTCEGNCTLAVCGNGITDAGEFCDDGNTVTEVGGCPGNCKAPVCGDGVTSVGEACDTGECVCDVFPSKFSFGRDCGTVDGAADCTLDGGTCVNAVASGPLDPFPICSSFCAFIPGLPGCAPGTCVSCSVTGNSNNLSGHCRDNCVNFSCGDGITDPGEGCDDGNFGTTGAQTIDDLDQCPNGPNAKALGLACNMANVCGDGFPLIPRPAPYVCNGPLCALSIPIPQLCDNGGGVITSSLGPLPAPKTCTGNPAKTCADDVDCTSDQGTAAPCGNGGAGGPCTPGGPYTNTEAGQCRCDCTPPRCGDGITDANEGCDDGNTVSGDGCQANCALPKCGDGITDAPAEACDAGAANGSKTSNCTATCKFNVCGDGSVQGTETCDAGASLDADTRDCRANCTINVCGDGVTDVFGPKNVEQCDDANVGAEDGCFECCYEAGNPAITNLAGAFAAKNCLLNKLAQGVAGIQLKNHKSATVLIRNMTKVLQLEALAASTNPASNKNKGRNSICSLEKRVQKLLTTVQKSISNGAINFNVPNSVGSNLIVTAEDASQWAQQIRGELFCPQ